jgi:hypothetical protein
VYGFARHKGYSTPSHMRALSAHGPCPEHRRSFANVGGSARDRDLAGEVGDPVDPEIADPVDPATVYPVDLETGDPLGPGTGDPMDLEN